MKPTSDQYRVCGVRCILFGYKMGIRSQQMLPQTICDKSTMIWELFDQNLIATYCIYRPCFFIFYVAVVADEVFECNRLQLDRTL